MTYQGMAWAKLPQVPRRCSRAHGSHPRRAVDEPQEPVSGRTTGEDQGLRQRGSSTRMQRTRSPSGDIRAATRIRRLDAPACGFGPPARSCGDLLAGHVRERVASAPLPLLARRGPARPGREEATQRHGGQDRAEVVEPHQFLQLPQRLGEVGVTLKNNTRHSTWLADLNAVKSAGGAAHSHRWRERKQPQRLQRRVRPRGDLQNEQQPATPTFPTWLRRCV